MEIRKTALGFGCRALLALGLAVVLTACGGGGGSLKDLNAMAATLDGAGFDCGDGARPYVSDDADDDTFGFGLADPVEELDCTVDDVALNAARWNKESDRVAALALIETFGCGFGLEQITVVTAGGWVLAADDDDADPEAVTAALQRAGEALGVKPKTVECDPDTSPADGATDDATDDADTVDDQPATTRTEGPGGRENPLALGEAASVGDWEVTVTAVTPDATDQVLDANQFNDPPEHGRYVLVEWDATYHGDDEASPDMDLTFVLSGSDKVQYKDFECGASINQSDVPTLEPGGTASGVVCMDAPAEAIDGGLVFAEEAWALGDASRKFWQIP